MKLKILNNYIIKLVRIFIKISKNKILIIKKKNFKINNNHKEILKINNKAIIFIQKQLKIFFLNNLFKNKTFCLKKKKVLSKNKNPKILLFLKNKLKLIPEK